MRYFANNPHFGIDEDKLDEILLYNLCGRSFPVSVTTKTLEKNFQELENRIEHRSDYRQDICYFYDPQQKSPSINLGGSQTIVQQIFREIQQIHGEYAPILCPIRLQSLEVCISQSISMKNFGFSLLGGVSIEDLLQ